MKNWLAAIVLGLAIVVMITNGGCAVTATGGIELPPPPPQSEREWGVPGQSWSWGTAGGSSTGGGFGTIRGAGEYRRLRK